MELNIRDIINVSKCWDYLRQIRWQSGLKCVLCSSSNIKKNGHCGKEKHNQSYQCNDCKSRFNDLTGTIFSHSNESLEVWVLTLYFMGLNLSNRQISKELDISEVTAQQMTSKLREGIVKKKSQ